MGTPWQHTMALEATAYLGGHPVVVAEQGDAMSVYEAQEF